MADECEYCGDASEFDVIADGNYIRVCKKCINNDMVVVTKPSKQQVDYSYKRPTVKQILTGMSGGPRNSIERLPNNAPTLSMLRTPAKDSAMKTRLTNMKIASPDQSRVVQQREPKMPSPAVSISPEKKDEIDAEDDFLDI